ncbi:MAG: NADH-quinone oxidoreductase subunit L [Bacteroidota bacterium]
MNQSYSELTAVLGADAESLLAFAALLLPLISCLCLLFFSHKLPRKGDLLAILAIGSSFILSLIILFSTSTKGLHHVRLSWLELQSQEQLYRFTVGLRIDWLCAMMMSLISGIAFLVHVFSVEYMKGDPNYGRYWAYLGLFCFSMLGLVMADNLLLIFMFWEAVGLSSYFLIGFWYGKDAPARAAQKAFIVNRVGDAGFLLGLMVLFSMFATLDLEALSQLFLNSSFENGLWQSQILLENGEIIQHSLPIIWLSIMGFLLFLGTIAKSAQFPLQIWLPDAMEGPTPVSALIHAATMVAAGVYLLARIFIFLSEEVLFIVALIGAITAFMAAVAAMTQWDIKRVLAYSTISQLGYMVMGMGLGAYNMALFHLFTHAFFKAALFLVAGIVIHQLAHSDRKLLALGFIPPSQDMHNMGGLRKSMPRTFILYMIPMLALAGVPFFSGFLSKDGILLAAWEQSIRLGGAYYLVAALGFLSAGLTAFYMARHAILIFWGKSREGAPKDPAMLMLLPVAILGIGSLGFVFSLNPVDGSSSWFIEHLLVPNTVLPQRLGTIMQTSGEGHVFIGIISTLIAFTGLGLGYWQFQKNEGKDLFPIGERLKNISFNHFYLDRIYHLLIIKPGLWLAKYADLFDQKVVDGIVKGISVSQVHEEKELPSLAAFSRKFDEGIIDGIVRGIVGFFAGMGRRLRHFQSGQVQQYLIWGVILMGLTFVLSYFFIL